MTDRECAVPVVERLGKADGDPMGNVYLNVYRRGRYHPGWKDLVFREVKRASRVRDWEGIPFSRSYRSDGSRGISFVLPYWLALLAGCAVENCGYAFRISFGIDERAPGYSSVVRSWGREDTVNTVRS